MHGQRPIEGVARFIDLAHLDRGLHAAAGLFKMSAVEEAAFSDVSGDVGHRTQDVVEGEVCQTEFLKARRIDDASLPVVVLGVIPAGGGGRLLAEVEGHGEFARGLRIVDLPMPDWPTRSEACLRDAR